MVPDVFNKETGIYRVYRIDYCIDVGPAVSLLRYAKGVGGLPDYAPNFYLNHQAKTSWETASSAPLRPGHWLLLAMKLT